MHTTDAHTPKAASWVLIVLCEVAVLAVALTAWFTLMRPSNDRNWVIQHVLLPRFTVADDTVTIENVRDATYHDDGSVTAWGFHPVTVHLSKLEGVDFVVSHFSEFRGVAHAFLSFNFGTEGRVAISMEIRREEGETYSPWLGMLRQYELLTVVGTERDLIGRRTNVDRDEVYLYPVRTTPEKARAVFLGLAARAEQLAANPEFYNTLMNNCTSNIIDQVEAVSDTHVPWYAGVLPGYSDTAAYELGLIDRSVPFADEQARARVPDTVSLKDPQYSAKIRGL